MAVTGKICSNDSTKPKGVEVNKATTTPKGNTTTTGIEKNIKGFRKMSREQEDLATHVEICTLRYKNLQDQIDTLELRVDRISADIKELRDDMGEGFGDIKKILVAQKDEKFKVVVSATASVVVGLLALLGYVITHLPK